MSREEEEVYAEIKGPWSYGYPALGEGWGMVRDASGSLVAQVSVPLTAWTAQARALRKKVDPVARRAHLIAAAPDLLEALRGANAIIGALVDTLKEEGDDIYADAATAQKAARAVIAKAEGRAQGDRPMSRPKRFRKKPVVIEAVRLLPPITPETMRWLQERAKDRIVVFTDQIEIETLEGTLYADPGDWIICGVKGELYPCKPDIFEETYEAVDESE